MPIPKFTIDGVLPPFVGPQGPGGAFQDMSPYAASTLEVCSTLGTTKDRREILAGWLKHRAELRKIGFDRGFQWLDGSFIEAKDPQDLDLATFLHRPAMITASSDLAALFQANLQLFERGAVKATFKLDAFFIDLQGTPEVTVSISRYYLGLFSHRRNDYLWKGMLEVRLEDVADDQAGLDFLAKEDAAAFPGPKP
jgi:hypothetical protein